MPTRYSDREVKMFRRTDFFPISTLWTDKALRWSVVLSVLALFVASLALFSVLKKQTVFVDKIAEVKILSETAAKELSDSALPISQITKEVGKDPVVLSGYAADVVDVCKSSPQSPDKQVILLTKQGAGFVAVTTNLDNATCKLFLNKEPTGTVWAVGDTAFPEIVSKPAFVMLNDSSVVDYSFRRLR